MFVLLDCFAFTSEAGQAFLGLMVLPALDAGAFVADAFPVIFFELHGVLLVVCWYMINWCGFADSGGAATYTQSLGLSSPN